MLTRLFLPALVAALLAAGPAGAQMARTEAREPVKEWPGTEPPRPCPSARPTCSCPSPPW